MNLPEPVGQAALAFFQKLLGPVGEASEILTDKIRFYRWRSSLNTLQRAREIARESKLSVNEVPLKFLIPFMEKASLEDENDPILDKWAQLLANASHDSRFAQNAFVDILSRLGSREAKLLDEIISQKKLDDASKELKRDSEFKTFFDKLKLQRFALIKFAQDKVGELTSETSDADVKNVCSTFTKLKDNLFVILSVSVWYTTPRGNLGRTYDTLREGYVEDSLAFDALSSLGLVSTFTFPFRTPCVVASLNILFPTVLGYEFVRSCRASNDSRLPNNDG